MPGKTTQSTRPYPAPAPRKVAIESVCVCVRERERERERVCVCVCVRRMASEVESFTIKPFESAEPAGRSGDEGKDETDMMCHEREQYNLMMGELVSLD